MSTDHEFAAELEEIQTALKQRALDGLALVTVEDAHVVLRHYGHQVGTMETGSYFTALIATVARADQWHRFRLGMVYPGLVAAANLIEHHEDGVKLLQAAGRIRACSACHGIGLVRSPDAVKLDQPGAYLGTCPACQGRGLQTDPPSA